MKNRFFLLLLSFSFSGCAMIYSYSDDLPQRIDHWVKEKKYNTALNTIDYIKPAHKHYKKLQHKKNLILKQVVLYENKGIKESTELAKQGDWILALKKLDEIESNIINTKHIEQHRAKLLQKRNKVISNFEYEVLNSQAIDLANKIELYEKINKTVTKDERNELGISEFNELRHKTSSKLAKQSEQLYKKGHYNKANETINLALKLDPDKDIRARLDFVKTLIKKETQLKTLSYVTSAKALLNKLSQGYSHAILKETKDIILWFNKNKENGNSHKALTNKLKKHLTAGMKQNFEAGRKLYSKGKTQEALSIWLELKTLEPDYPKLQAHISRAEKVINKLKKLSNKPVKNK